MSTPEKKVKDKVRALLKQYGAYYAMPATGGFGASGVPDFLVCFTGRFIGIECKAGGNTPTKLQENNLEAINKTGGIALVINEHNISSLEIVLSNLEKHKNG